MPFSHSKIRPRPSTLQAGVLQVAAFEGFAPFAWKENGEARGRDIMFLKHFAAIHGLEVAVKFFPFDQLWEQPARAKADIAASGLSLSPDVRKGLARWSLPYAQVRRSLLVRENDRERFPGMAGLGRIAVVAGSLAHDHARETLPQTAGLSFCETLESGIADLLSGRVDAVGTGNISARHHLSRRAGLAMVDVHGGRNPEHISFAVRAHGLLPRMLNAFIASHARYY